MSRIAWAISSMRRRRTAVMEALVLPSGVMLRMRCSSRSRARSIAARCLLLADSAHARTLTSACTARLSAHRPMDVSRAS